MLKENPMVKKLVSKGEESIGKLTSQLLANEKFVSAVQSVVAKSLSAKGTLDKNLRMALSAMNVPSVADVQAVQQKLSDLEAMLDKISEKVEALSDTSGPGSARP